MFHKPKSTRLIAVTTASLFLMVTLATPGSALFSETRPAPDMCDDTQVVGKDDEWKMIEGDDPTKRATVTIVPTLIAQEAEDPGTESETAFPYILAGTMRYRYEIWECKDYTDVNSAGFFVYKYHSRFSEDQGIWSMGENDPVVQRSAQRFMYSCDEANCDQAAEPMTRSETLYLAETYATRWPNYSSALYGYASLSLRDQVLDFEGEYDTSSDTGNFFPTQTFRGCGVESAVCVSASAQPSFL